MPTITKQARIAVIDDMPDTRDAMARALAAGGHRVDQIAPSDGVIGIKSSVYDALVIDFRLGSRGPGPATALDVLKSLGSVAPPTVIATASMGAPAVLSLSSAAVTDAGVPAFRVFHKGAGFSKLADHVQLAIGDAHAVSPQDRAAVFERLQVPSSEAADPLERRSIAADVAEKLRNFIAEVDATIPPESTGRAALAIREQRELLGDFTSTKILGLSPRDTAEALHEIANRLAIMEPRALQQNKRTRELAHAHASVSAFVHDAQSEYENRTRPSFILAEELERLFGHKFDRHGIYFMGQSTSGPIGITDQNYAVRAFLGKFAERSLPHEFDLSVRHYDQRSLGKCADGAKAQRDLACGAAVEVRIRFYWGEAAEGPAWRQFEDLMFEVHALRKAGLLWAASYNFEPKLEPSDGFTFFLKASEFDQVAHDAELARQACIRQEKLEPIENRRDRTPVVRVTVPSGSFIAIGFDPASLMEEGHDMSYLPGEEPILASGRHGHTDADLLVYLFLNRVRGIGEDRAFHTARRETIRLKTSGTECLVDDDDLERAGNLKALLRDVGVTDTKAAPYEFCSRIRLSWLQIPDDHEDDDGPDERGPIPDRHSSS